MDSGLGLVQWKIRLKLLYYNWVIRENLCIYIYIYMLALYEENGKEHGNYCLRCSTINHKDTCRISSISLYRPKAGHVLYGTLDFSFQPGQAFKSQSCHPVPQILLKWSCLLKLKRSTSTIRRILVQKPRVRSPQPQKSVWRLKIWKTSRQSHNLWRRGAPQSLSDLAPLLLPHKASCPKSSGSRRTPGPPQTLTRALLTHKPKQRRKW